VAGSYPQRAAAAVGRGIANGCGDSRYVERLEEQGASYAGFAKEIDHLFTRVAEIEKHLSIDKKIAA
jgi:hypothetical protein